MPPQVTIVTGAAGFAGRHLVDRLRTRGPVLGWCRPGSRPTEAPGVTWQPVDVLDRTAVSRAIADAGPARLYHLAGAPHVATSWHNVVGHLQTNVMGTHHIIDAVRTHARSCRVLVVSSAQIYAPLDGPIGETAPLRPSNPYGLSKLAQDQIAIRAAEDDHLDVVVARPFNHIGPGQQPAFAVSHFARQIALIEAGRAAPILHVGNLDARRDMTDVRDVAAAYVRIMDAGSAGRPYNVCSGRVSSMRDLLDHLRRLSSVDIRVEIDPDRLRPLDAAVIQGDGSRLREELGWTPEIDLARTLQDTLDGWRRTARESS